MSTTTDEEATLVASPSTSAPSRPRRGRGSRTPAGRRGEKPPVFVGMTFLVTQGTRPQEEASSKMWTETEDEEEQEGDIKKSNEPRAFSKSGLRQMITENGGRVLSAFPDGANEPIPADVVIISDRTCQTMTYLLAIVYRYARVNYIWVHDSIHAG